MAVRNVSLELEPGRIYGLLGPNGSGKTTTLRTMIGLVEPDRGQVELFGRPPDDEGRSRVGYVPEQRGLPESARVRATLQFLGWIRGLDRAEAGKRADHWLARLEISDKADARIKTLSNGQQQKVQIAVALLGEPELILLDEPLAALDPEHQELIIEAVREAARRGATVVLSTHRLREAQLLLDHVVMMHHGEKVLDQPLQQALDEAFEGVWRIRTLDDGAWITGPEVSSVTAEGPDWLVRLQPDATIGPVLQRAAQSGARLRALEAVVPTLHELYLQRARARGPIDGAD